MQNTITDTGAFQQYLPEYERLLAILAARYDIDYVLRLEEDFLRQSGMAEVIQDIVAGAFCLLSA